MNLDTHIPPWIRSLLFLKMTSDGALPIHYHNFIRFVAGTQHRASSRIPYKWNVSVFVGLVPPSTDCRPFNTSRWNWQDEVWLCIFLCNARPCSICRSICRFTGAGFSLCCGSPKFCVACFAQSIVPKQCSHLISYTLRWETLRRGSTAAARARKAEHWETS